MELLREIEGLLERIPADFGGGSPLEKTFLVCHLAALKRLGTYVEIGVYRGRSFFPLALTVQRQGGKAYGIDPYAKDDAFESDVAAELKERIDAFVRTTDFDRIHHDVEQLIDELGMRDTARILRATSEKAVRFFHEQGISIGMLHVDGNHDTRFVMRDVELYLPLVEPDGIVVMDDTDWDSVKPACAWVRERMAVLFETPAFAIFANREDGGDLAGLRLELSLLHEALAVRSGKST
jgi:predicted O-methyltransferase YrrM